MITIQREEKVMKLRPELVAAMLLLRMKQEAEAALGEIGGAVVSVPVYATNAQREAIVTACKLADLELLDLISEPTATALVYRENLKGSIDETTATALASKDKLNGTTNEPNASNLRNTKNQNSLQPHNVLVFDMGAGKLDASIISVSENEVRVLAASGDEALGGDHLDWKLLDKIEKITNLKFKENEPNAPRDLLRRKFSCEQIKLNLTLLKDTQVTSDDLGIDHKEFEREVTRKQFEETVSGLLDEKLEAIFSHLIKKANMFKTEVKEVIVVGGSSRIPRVQQIVMDFFEITKLNMTVNADEAIAEGAALWALKLASQSVHPQGVSESSGHSTCFSLRDLVPDPSKPPGKNNLKHFIERKANISISIRAPTKSKKASDGHRLYQQGKYGIFLVQSHELPLKLAVSLGMMPPLSKKQVSNAVTLLGQLETERGNHLKQLEVADELEHFCYNLRSKLNSLLASTEEVIEFLSAIDGMAEKDAEKIKNGLLEKCNKLSTLDENHADNESSLSKNKEYNVDCSLVTKDADCKICGTDREKMHFISDMPADDYEILEDRRREKVYEPVCSVTKNTKENISCEARRKNNRYENSKADGKQVTCVNASSEQAGSDDKAATVSCGNADLPNPNGKVTPVLNENADTPNPDGKKTPVLSGIAGAYQTNADGKVALVANEDTVGNQTNADGSSVPVAEEKLFAEQSNVACRDSRVTGGNGVADQANYDYGDVQISSLNQNSLTLELLERSRQYFYTSVHHDATDRQCIGKNIHRCTNADGRGEPFTCGNAGADQTNADRKNASVADGNAGADKTIVGMRGASVEGRNDGADKTNDDGNGEVTAKYDQTSSPLNEV
ncbi:hypothetical protein HAZT_HAZT005731, partial [Hyalella azteca]